MAKKKFYAVAEGKERGVFEQWGAVEKLVKGFPGARYKSFPTAAEAQAWLANPVYEKRRTGAKSPTAPSRIGQPADGALLVYTDGGCINNPGPGGYGVVIDSDGEQQELTGGFRQTTNNRMELMAAIVALQHLGETSRKIHLYTDSSYLVNGITKGWVRKWQKNGWRKSDRGPVLNVDLWKKLLALLENLDVRFQWVKGHAGHELNERCDRLAVSSARNNPAAIDQAYENHVREQGRR